MSDTATVLVVDDTPANVGVLLEALGDAGHEVLVAESGQSALAQLQHATPDLILLDVMMPGLDGFETCRRLKQNAKWRSIPVLFMTALDEPAQKVRAFDEGAVDYIVKPFFEQEVLARVKTHLELLSLRRNLEDELALRIDAENQLAKSLDRAVIITDARGMVVFTTRLAESLLHRHCDDYQTAGELPASLRRPDSGLTLRRFTESGRDDLSFFVLEEKAPSPNPSALLALGLTSREAEVLWWIAQGKSNPDIATILGAGVRTIHKHVENIFRKLGCETRAAAAVTAQEALRPGGIATN
ncbi:response regulator transcription factor [Synoicihabitans lomoniglobus]|uniref:Response regulator transcription factor n=1 Tax=Synoicihabitans lomoniglobus TaxID=2909285 RepID=A0AAF0I886_9BACT|nr:response regulator transcription factor [Opitutaceae bacterium LMO-M01]WED67456.1 response regulator transcription factor [Opitutaceae bacterium LMO-M01]